MPDKIHTSVTYHKELQPKIWDGMNMCPNVRQTLFRIAQAFLKMSGVDIAPKDVLLVGSAANYNWNSRSDLDLQVIAPIKSDLAKELLDTKKKVFKRDHDLTVKGMPVEVTVTREMPPCEAAFSVMTDQWVKPPVYEKPEFDREKADALANNWVRKVKAILNDRKSTWRKVDDVKSQIKSKRSKQLQQGGEYTPANLAYKALRKHGYIEALRHGLKKRIEKSLSLKEATAQANGIFAQALMTSQARSDLIKALGDHPFTLDRDLHCTVMYDEKPINIELPEINKKSTYHARVIGVEHWFGYDGEGFVILRLDSLDLQALHDQFVDAGCEPTFAEYKPHITLVHPVPDPIEYQSWMIEFNQRLQYAPLELELYWGGLSLL